MHLLTQALQASKHKNKTPGVFFSIVIFSSPLYDQKQVTHNKEEKKEF